MEPTTNEEKKRGQESDAPRKQSEENLPTANILVAGITGSGKSTLLNAVFGQHLADTGTGQPVTDHIQEYSDANTPIRIWDTVGLEIDPEKTQSSIDSIKKTIAEKASSKDQFDRIHAIWYCINSQGGRYQGAETNFIHDLHALNVPFIIVLTQCIVEEDEINDFISIIKQVNAEQGMGDIPVVPLLAKEYHLRGMPPISAFGLEDLVETTLQKLHQFIKESFIAAQQVDKMQKRVVCEKIIQEQVEQAKAGFWDKVPFVNIIPANRNIITMIKRIASLYNTYLDEDDSARIMDGTSVNAENIFKGLILLDIHYTDNVAGYLKEMKDKGFKADIDVHDLKKYNRVAVMIAYYGYIFVDAVERFWDEKTDRDALTIEEKAERLVDLMNETLRQTQPPQKIKITIQ